MNKQIQPRDTSDDRQTFGAVQPPVFTQKHNVHWNKQWPFYYTENNRLALTRSLRADASEKRCVCSSVKIRLRQVLIAYSSLGSLTFELHVAQTFSSLSSGILFDLFHLLLNPLSFLVSSAYCWWVFLSRHAIIVNFQGQVRHFVFTVYILHTYFFLLLDGDAHFCFPWSLEYQHSLYLLHMWFWMSLRRDQTKWCYLDCPWRIC